VGKTRAEARGLGTPEWRSHPSAVSDYCDAEGATLAAGALAAGALAWTDGSG
jgi:hypothetical protein